MSRCDLLCRHAQVVQAVDMNFWSLMIVMSYVVFLIWAACHRIVMDSIPKIARRHHRNLHAALKFRVDQTGHARRTYFQIDIIMMMMMVILMMK